MTIFTRMGRTLLIAAVLVVGSLGLAGCDGDKGTVGSGDGGGDTPGTTPGGGVNNNCTSGETCKSKEMPDGKTWTTENLNIATADSWCYDNDPANCDKYGRLYTWDAAMTACQSVGWRLPTNQEWQSLVDYAGGNSTAGKKLKSTSGWNSNRNGTDNYGFSALPGGVRRYSDGDFYEASNYGYWWTATEGGNGSRASYRDMFYSTDYVNEYSNPKDYGYSVRCIAD
ncbi:hypothetical protein R80B4_02479 [Fibrobacteres bacterium R8-0-B4]